MSFTEDDVVERLRKVDDPEIGESIMDLEMVNDIKVEGSMVILDVDLPSESMREDLRSSIQSELSSLPGIEDLRIEWQTDEGIEEESEMIPGIGDVIAVSSGKGGVGKSTFAVNLAYSLSMDGYSVGLLDADVYGPNVPRMLGDIGEPMVTPDEKLKPPETDNIKVMSMGYLTGENSPVIWRGVMVHKALTQLLGDVEWGEADYLIVDLPPGTGDAQLTIAQTIPVTGAVIVTTPQQVSVDDARRGVEMFREANVDVAGIVENMSSFVCPDCGGTHDIFGSGGGEKLAEESDVPFLGGIPIDKDVRTSSDSGKPLVADEERDSATREAFLDVSRNTRRSIDDLSKKHLPMI